MRSDRRELQAATETELLLHDRRNRTELRAGIGERWQQVEAEAKTRKEPCVPLATGRRDEPGRRGIGSFSHLYAGRPVSDQVWYEEKGVRSLERAGGGRSRKLVDRVEREVLQAVA